MRASAQAVGALRRAGAPGAGPPAAGPDGRPSAWVRKADALLAVDTLLLRTAGTLLLAVAVLKILSAMSGVRYLALPDTVLSFLSHRQTLLAAALTELFFAALLLLAPQAWYSREGLLALCATFVAYRVGLYCLGVAHSCPCLGRASDWLHLSPRQADSLALALLLVLASIAATSLVIHHGIAIAQDAPWPGARGKLP